MDLELLKQVNRLWHSIYPYLAAQVIESCRRDSGRVLELGPFSGGISVELKKKHPVFDLTVADEDPRVVEYFAEELRAAGFSTAIKTRKSTYDPLVFEDCEFDLVVCRGVFFFLDEQGRLFREISRALSPDGMAFVGGGFGKDTPLEFIDEIADESRKLNDLLGRKRISVKRLQAIIDRAGMTGSARIVKQGGLWVILDKARGGS